MLPRIPVKITAITVTGTIPPWASQTPMAIGVVIDFGIRDAVMASSKPNSRQRSQTLPMDAREPTVQPARIGMLFFFRIWIFV